MAATPTNSVKIALVTGGWSDEREISLDSAHACEKALREVGFSQVEMIDIAQADAISRLQEGNYDVAFIAMHGRWGEDGCIQGLMEILNIPYTYSGVRASSMAAEKDFAKLVYQKAGIPTPEGITLEHDALDDPELTNKLVEQFGLPLFVKPACNGSSYGVSMVNSTDEIIPAIELALSGGESALVERCIHGTEITVPVLGNNDAQALPIIEIVTGAEFYDLSVKYEPSELHHMIPARLSEDVYATAQDYAVRAHQALGCAGASRSDFIVTEDGVPYILETNTIPGMTETSLLPDSARHAGMSFDELCARLVELALERGNLGKRA